MFYIIEKYDDYVDPSQDSLVIDPEFESMRGILDESWDGFERVINVYNITTSRSNAEQMAENRRRVMQTRYDNYEVKIIERTND